MCASHKPADAKADPVHTEDLIGKLTQLSNFGQPDVIARMLAGLDKHELQELDRLLAKVIQAMSAH